MSKYYTPEIEEFHIGFVFEAKDDPDIEWRFKVFEDGESTDYYDQYRVKHLDREDIESLGFKSRDLKHWEDEEEDVIYKKGNYTLVFWENAYKSDYRTNIYIRQERGLGQHSFKGEVKNKSELKKVFKMIGI